MSVIPKIPRASGGFAPCASYKGSNLDQLGTLSGPKTPRLLTTPLITNPGSPLFITFQDNPTYTPTTLTKEEILDNHGPVLCSFGVSTKDDELDLPSLYWIPQLDKCPFKWRYILLGLPNAPRNLSPNY
jgi:hypothetical protein